MNSLDLPIGIARDPLLYFLVSRRYRFYRHIVPLLLLFLFSQTGEEKSGDEIDLLISSGVFLSFLGVIYFNMYFLVPKLLFQKNYVRYVLLVITIILLSFFLLGVADHLASPKHHVLPEKQEDINLLEGVFAYTFLFSIIISASSAIKLFQRWILDSYLINEMEKRKLQSELDQLKNQINPHFLFNMLNNAHVLTYNDPRKASQVLIKLSDLLRYQLYDSARSKVLLTSEIQFLADLLELEKIRRDNFEYFISREGNISSVMIPPFLFIVFVENAIKHNMDAKNISSVQLFFKVDDGTLFFKCVNSKPVDAARPNVTGGLGLVNVKRRLELLYNKNHVIEITEDLSSYTVTLTIPI